MRIQLDKSFIKKLTKRVEGYDVKVGILDDKEHRDPIDEIGQYAGGPVRKMGKLQKPTKSFTGPIKPNPTTGQIFVENMQRKNINFLLRPFEEKSSELIRFMDAFLKTALGKSQPKRVENLLQAVVRNPILRAEYGKNKASTADAKGFDRALIDTGQMFRAIKAKVTRV